ncbi:MAG TPA: prepilin-type N-terminal cleavage/methylation domain-containing protein [Ideonella sp.]|uniref:type II secretion system protein n=1 Tax=Ideonella sp. TaxID=1929293 RepID=UPI002B810FB5|nr:prepilin-type N-terminal cleavage/methylation domain-containing protein [Ideonella sp.]HSI48012.1 prepilin-type N-terminal cleavage/methylation domain-containing protein [Ideonella sp.]
MPQLKQRAFTLIELMVVMAVIGMLLAVAMPRYVAHVDRAREAVLRANLRAVREIIDKFHGDRGRYPDSLEEMVTAGYLRQIPTDPMTDSTLTWRVIRQDGTNSGAISDLQSGAAGKASDGSLYAAW